MYYRDVGLCRLILFLNALFNLHVRGLKKPPASGREKLIPPFTHIQRNASRSSVSSGLTPVLSVSRLVIVYILVVYCTSSPALPHVFPSLCTRPGRVSPAFRLLRLDCMLCRLVHFVHFGALQSRQTWS
jgi:hypothetical protein